MIRTRFAPSPTGSLHIGGVRTALFNWLFAKKNNGQFILRIDDTDAERNRPETVLPITDGFKWLGMDYDEIHFQSDRRENHYKAAMMFLNSGHAYPDYTSKEELDSEREKAKLDKVPYIHRGLHRDSSVEENVKLYNEKPTTLRFKIPLNRTSIVDDIVCGKCEQETNLISDPVILRADGSPIYNFASVVDDVQLDITHIIRAREHLANTYIQVLFFEVFNYNPKFAHIPVVNEPNSHRKLSKRDMTKFITPEIKEKLKSIGCVDEGINPATLEYYKVLGYLPEGIINYLSKLGWSLDDSTEFFTIQDLIQNFSLERINDSPAGFDSSKCFWINSEHMKLVSVEKKVESCIPYLEKAGYKIDKELILEIIKACDTRIKLFSDIVQFAGPVLVDEVLYNEKAVEKRLKKSGAMELLIAFFERLKAIEFSAIQIEKTLVDYCEEKGVKNSELIHPVRVAMTGTEIGFGLYDTLELIGKEKCLSRLEKIIIQYS